MQKKSQEAEWKYSAATIQNGIVDVVKTSYKPACRIRKISATEYIKGQYDQDGNFWSDGLVYEFEKKEGEMRNRRSLRQIFRSLRQLIAANYSGGKSELFVTLTYAEQHNDPEKIHKDLVLFWKRLSYQRRDLRYIAIVEPHATGNFHVHLLLADTTGAELFIPNEEMEKIWGHGFTKTERLEDIDHMGAYFIAYFSNLELDPEEIAIYGADDDVEYKNGKAYIKGKRLDMYPEHMRIYRHSRNCDKPIKIEGMDSAAAVEGARKIFSKETEFTDQNGAEHRILTEQYRLK